MVADEYEDVRVTFMWSETSSRLLGFIEREDGTFDEFEVVEREDGTLEFIERVDGTFDEFAHGAYGVAGTAAADVYRWFIASGVSSIEAGQRTQAWIDAQLVGAANAGRLAVHIPLRAGT